MTGLTKVAGGCTGTEPWTEHHVERTDAAGVANDRTRSQAAGKALVKNLKVGDWVAVQARERWSTKEVVHYRPGTHSHLLAAHAAISHTWLPLCRSLLDWARG